MPIMEVLVGTIASGKSTYAQARAAQGSIIVNDDAIVNAVHADQYTLYQESLKPLYKGVELFIVNTALAIGKDVLVDKGLSLSRASRQRWISIGRSLDVPVKCILFPPSWAEVHARRRVEADSRGHDYDYWLRVATHHLSVYEPPSTEEGFDSIETRVWVDR